jgi:uncharacterized membrane protein
LETIMTTNQELNETYFVAREYHPRSIFLWIAVPLSMALIVILLTMAQSTLTYREIFNDPADTIHFNPFMGLVSMLGLFGWAAAAGIALLTYTVVRSRETALMRRFFLAAGLFTVLLLADDAFMLHEEILPHGIGIRERYIKVGYLAIAAAFGLGFFKVLIRNNFSLLALVAIFFAASFLFDNPATLKAVGLWESDFVLYIAEDGSKFIGITLWLTYLAKTAAESLSRLMGR